MQQNSRFVGFNHAKISEIEWKSHVCSSALCNNMFVRVCFVFSTLFEKEVSEPFDPLEQVSCRSEQCVPRYGWIFSDPATKKLLGRFLMSGKV